MSMSKEWVEYEGKSGPGKGKHIVLIAGDEEYRSEEGLPKLAKIPRFPSRFQMYGPLLGQRERRD